MFSHISFAFNLWKLLQMNSDDEYFSEDSDKNKSSSKKRCIRLLISSLNNQTFIHTSIKNSDNDFNVDADSRWEELGLMNVKHNINCSFENISGVSGGYPRYIFRFFL